MDELTPQPALCIVEIEHARSLLATCPCPRSHGRCRRLPRHISRCRKHLNTQPISQTRRNTPRLSHSARNSSSSCSSLIIESRHPFTGWLCVWLFRECLFVFFSVCPLLYRCTKATRAALWCTAMFGVMILLLLPMSQCECTRLWDAGQCVSYVRATAPTRYIRLNRLE